MQIILLSGGEGKRLFPLSNTVRSKQFLRVLHSPAGNTESMVQRVVRQIGESGLDCELTVATGTAQKEMIIRQLGSEVSIVAEPERRDTFPAISLAATYLASEKHCSSDEVVVVMPCDPFTDAGYFATIARMCQAVKTGMADLVLMGIRPTYPSTKFGYVVPSCDSDSADMLIVDRFTEKPDEHRAAKLIEDGAFWNGGVFAFRLGYMTDIVKRYVETDDFSELRTRYGELPKISFDYEVAEKAESIAMVPFSGEWKDLGTWNALAEQLSERIVGNVVVDADTENTCIVNELQIPIVCLGARDMIVAASADGILVCESRCSERLKDYVGKVISDTPMYCERQWGERSVVDRRMFADSTSVRTEYLHVDAGCTLDCAVTADCQKRVLTVIDGKGELIMDGLCKNLCSGDTVAIHKGQSCIVQASTDIHIIEVTFES